jgi:hypothetical protein
MNPMKWSFTLLGRMRRVVGGLVAALLLMPLPAMAITYLGSWTVASSSATGGPTPPTFTIAGDNVTNAGQNDQLLVSIPDYQGSTANATSTITLTRPVSISQPGGQTVEFDHSFTGLFSQAGYSVTVALDDSSGHVVLTPISVNKSTTSTQFAQLQDSVKALERKIPNGSYTLVVTLTDTTSNKIGGWKRYQSISAHEFDFQGQ